MNSADSDTELHYDICVIGGGINGVGVARDAAGRGLSVVLLEKDDLAQGTSSRSGKLIHGGLRYLENYEFRLVREALIEREVLLASAPHIIWPMRFVLPHSRRDRPAWLVRLGLFLYDHLGGRKQLPATRSIDLTNAREGEGLKPQYKKAFEYSDCWVDDSRLVILNALDAAERGASIRSRTKFLSASRMSEHWNINAYDSRLNQTLTVSAKCLVNASGPWVNQVITDVDSLQTKRRVRLVKGSHLVVQKFWPGDQAYLIQNHDKRVIFINPYEENNALVGTTDIPYDGNPDLVKIDEEEITYLLNAVNSYFSIELKRHHVLQTFSGVRPLYDDNSDNPSAVTRDYLFDIDKGSNNLPVLSIFGGKITTFRKLAEHAIGKLTDTFPHMGPAWTAKSVLPGGDIDNGNFEVFISRLEIEFPKLPGNLIHHYARLYGTRTKQLLTGVEETHHLGRQFSETLYEKEVRYLLDYEFALTVEDILSRRTKHALHMTDQEIAVFSQWFSGIDKPYATVV